jgi:SAM-dependent methyltransferase
MCQAGGAKDLFSVGQSQLCACANCGLRFLFPQTSDHRLLEIYEQSYFLGSLDELERLKRATAALYLGEISKRLGTVKNKRLLEIGCGRGYLLKEAQALGMFVNGLESSPDGVSRANEWLGSEIVSLGILGDNVFADETFDVVIATDVIEHVRDPKSFMAQVHKILSSGGLFYCVTPSLDSLSARLMGRYWMEYKEEHLFYFNRNNMASLCEGAGFRNIQIHDNFKILNAEYIAAHFERYPVPTVSPIVVNAAKLLPKRLAHMPVKIVASGMTLCATK